MDLAIKFNNAGCLLYRMGRGEDAFELFSGAMQAMHHSCGGNNREELDAISRQLLLVDPSVQRAFDKVNVCGTTSPYFAEATGTSQMSPETDDVAACSVRQPVEVETAYPQKRSPSIDVPFIWTEAYTMDALDEIVCSRSVRFSIAMSIVLYNEALILHRGQVTNSKRCLERALTFYSMAGRSLLENCPRDLIQSHNLTTMLCCGILNNTGYILHQTGDFEASRLCFARLNEFLTSLGPPASVAERRQREEFGLNFILFYKSLSTAAAA